MTEIPESTPEPNDFDLAVAAMAIACDQAGLGVRNLDLVIPGHLAFVTFLSGMIVKISRDVPQ